MSVSPSRLSSQTLTSLQHCPDPERKQDCPEEPSSHNVDHLLNGQFGRWYREMAPDLQRLAQPGQTLFGDLLVDEEGMNDVGGGFRFNHGRADDVTLFPEPGRAGREKQKQKLVQQQPYRDDDDDWFDDQRRDHGRPRQQQRPPSRNVRVNYRSSEPVHDIKYYDAPPPPPRYSPLPLPPPPPPRAPRSMYFDGAPVGPRPGPSRRYPSSHELSTGYKHAHSTSPPPSAPKRGPELSIRGAAQRRQEQERTQRGGGGGHRGGEGGRERDGGQERSRRADGHREWSQRNGYHNDRRRY